MKKNPKFSDLTRFYIASDNELMIDILKGEINFLKTAWQNLLGRPLVTLVLKNIQLGRWKTISKYFFKNICMKKNNKKNIFL